MNRFALALVVALVFAFVGSASANPQRSAKPPAAGSVAPAAVINLNSATATQIATLPGIGQKTAELVVQYRQKNGPFKKIEEIMNVKGIGEKSFLRIKDRLTVATEKAEK